jgi:hypothetical protein
MDKCLFSSVPSHHLTEACRHDVNIRISRINGSEKLTLRRKLSLPARSEVLTATSMNMAVCWDVAPCSLAEVIPLDIKLSGLPS